MIMVALAVEESPVDLGAPEQMLACCFVADYLRDAGIRHPDLLSRLSRRFVEEAEQLLEDTHPAASSAERTPFTVEELIEAALHLALRELEAVHRTPSVPGVSAVPAAVNLSGDAQAGSSFSSDAEVQEVVPAQHTIHRRRTGQGLDGLALTRIQPEDVAPQSQRNPMRVQLRPKLLWIFRKGFWRRFWQQASAASNRWKLNLESLR